MRSISAEEFLSKLKSDPRQNEDWLLDVRETNEHRLGLIPKAKPFSLSQIEQRSSEIPRDKTVYVYCRSGQRSREAIARLEELGFTNLINIEGGLVDYQRCGGLLQGARRGLPIMQQVQIIAGSLVLLGILLARWVHPSFLGLSVFVGAGLIVAGITGFCGMAKLLALMPWNRSSSTTFKAE